MRRMRRFGWIAVAIMALLPACSGSGDVLARFQPRIGNAADDFHFQVAGLNGVTATREYTWTNTGQKAGISHAAQLTGGTATVTVYDAARTQVYSQSVAPSGSYESITGQTGDWRIRVELANASGNLDFGVKMRPLAGLPEWVNVPR